MTDAEPAGAVAADSPAALARPDDLVVAVARYLRRLHGIDRPVGDTVVATTSGEPPSAATADAYLARARARMAAGEIDQAVFDEPYRPHDPARLLDIAAGLAATLAARPAPPARPVHGALRLGDLRIADGAVVAPSPTSSAIGDPYVDLAFLARDLAAAVGPGAVAALFDAYGEVRPDPVRIELWVTLRQFWS